MIKLSYFKLSWKFDSQVNVQKIVGLLKDYLLMSLVKYVSSNLIKILRTELFIPNKLKLVVLLLFDIKILLYYYYYNKYNYIFTVSMILHETKTVIRQ